MKMVIFGSLIFSVAMVDILLQWKVVFQLYT